MIYIFQIFRDDGDKKVIFEREVSSDEIIDTLSDFCMKEGKKMAPEKPENKYKTKKVKVEVSTKIDRIIHGDKKTKSPTCKNCGEVGHRSNHCRVNGEKKDLIDDIDETGAMNKKKYDTVRTMKHTEYSSRETADTLDLDIEEVNFAYSSLTYEGYLKLR